jgi:hypothetical protein
MKIRFLPYSGDLMNLTVNKHYIIFRWVEPDCKVLFSICKQGNGAPCHFASDKKGMFKIRRAINEWCEFVFWLFDWCKMIIAKVILPKVGHILERCGFKKIINGKKSIYIRCRSWDL